MTRAFGWMIAGLVFGLAGALFYASRHPGSRDLFDLAYGFGAYIRELATNGVYRAQFADHPTYGPIEFRTGRLPLIPWFGWLASLFGPDVVGLYVVKNVVAVSLLAWAVFTAIGESARFKVWHGLPLALFLLIPTHAAVLYAIDFEEGYMVPLLCTALILSTMHCERMSIGKAIGLALVLMALVLLKSSLLLVAGAFAVVAVFRPKSPLATRLVPIAGVAAAVFGWGFFAYEATGRFAFGGDMSSVNGPNFFKANNEHTLDYYPLLHLDLLEENGLLTIREPLQDDNHEPFARPKFRDEWDLHDQAMKRGWEFRRDHPEAVAEMNRHKLHAMFLRTTPAYFMEPVPQTLGQDYRLWLARIAQWLGLGALAVGLLQRRTRLARQVASTTLLVYAAYLVPYALGFVYERHMTPIIALSLFAAMLVWSNPRPAPDPLGP